ncbi:MAG: D-alanyl-D-alanine carboxypeptidase family protein [Caulobacter sp.]|nr:D-alanyl-D-alanine carboxypeptidase family protein [Caulobacter sp.]
MRGLVGLLGAIVSGTLRVLGWTAAAAIVLVAILFAGWLILRPSTPAPAADAAPASLPEPYVGESFASRVNDPVSPAITDRGGCDRPGRFPDAPQENARSLTTLVWSPFGPEEIGWEIYVPLIAEEIATRCGPAEPGFAEALAAWQRRKGRRANGVMNPADFDVMKQAWHRRRPFSRIRPEDCPPPPADAALATASLSESYGRPMRLRPGALAAYRRMTAAARAEAPRIFRQPNAMKIFSAYRDPEADAARCLGEGNCDGVRRTQCSAHRTGLALDIHVGMAPGGNPASTADFNRLAQSRSDAYRWMVRNASRFGFVNYPYEPWHWEWTGEPI